MKGISLEKGSSELQTLEDGVLSPLPGPQQLFSFLPCLCLSLFSILVHCSRPTSGLLFQGVFACCSSQQLSPRAHVPCRRTEMQRAFPHKHFIGSCISAQVYCPVCFDCQGAHRQGVAFSAEPSGSKHSINLLLFSFTPFIRCPGFFFLSCAADVVLGGLGLFRREVGQR